MWFAISRFLWLIFNHRSVFYGCGYYMLDSWEVVSYLNTISHSGGDDRIFYLAIVPFASVGLWRTTDIPTSAARGVYWYTFSYILLLFLWCLICKTAISQGSHYFIVFQNHILGALLVSRMSDNWNWRECSLGTVAIGRYFRCARSECGRQLDIMSATYERSNSPASTKRVCCQCMEKCLDCFVNLITKPGPSAVLTTLQALLLLLSANMMCQNCFMVF